LSLSYAERVNPYQFRISLRANHPTKALSFMTELLGLAPGRQWTSGDPRSAPDGTPLDGVYTESYWTARLLGGVIKDSTEQSLDEALQSILETLSPHSAFLRDFQQAGGSFYLFIGIFGPKNFGLELSSELMSALGEAGLTIGLDVYPGGPHSV
jgi:hypothetical protein